ncbi:MAG: SBBP repeat-containing protein [Methylacidiphilales bacterium]|nr:SBBP repeat-containing protein [Candidatus Methylacidiphilales bacterium]MDW8349679.1 SBBP repeat-containing protein [Verrucomicrobiae bacterium]
MKISIKLSLVFGAISAIVITTTHALPYREWATYFGGIASETPNAIATDQEGNIYVV